MRYLPFIIVNFLGLSCLAQGISGTIKSRQTDAPVNAVLVINITTQSYSIADARGRFYIAGANGHTIQFVADGYSPQKRRISSNDIGIEIEIFLDEESDDKLDKQNDRLSGAVSPKSMWVGAKLGYNIEGFSDADPTDDFIGAAKVKLNPLTKQYLKADWGIIGNIANFIANQNKEDGEKNLQQLSLSVQGLEVGMFGQWTWGLPEVDGYGSIYITNGYRLNIFKQTGKDSSTVSISQFKTSVGLEFEAFEFVNKGKFNISLEGSLRTFDPNRYAQVFGEKKRVLLALDFTTILPLGNHLGFFVNPTFSPGLKPVYYIGFIVK